MNEFEQKQKENQNIEGAKGVAANGEHHLNNKPVNNKQAENAQRAWTARNAGVASGEGYENRSEHSSQNRYGYVNNRGFAGTPPPVGGGEYETKKKTWYKGLVIFIIILLVIMLAGYGCTAQIKSILNTDTSGNDWSSYEFADDYVGLLYLEGTISEGDSGDGYSQAWILDRVEQMMYDDNNKGILLSVNTPGGSAFATYNLYQALLNYKETTGRPIYVYMDSQATSGGYYVSMAGEKIYAHPECWTGSIGVIVGTLYDFSGLFEKYGISAYSITSGKNKDIAANYKPLSDEQRAILQSVVDDSYGRFVDAVVSGRNMDEAKVRELADGRIYTANQAKENNLIDEVGTMQDAINDMAYVYALGEINFEPIYFVEEVTLFEELTGMKAQDLIRKNEVDTLLGLIEDEMEFEVQYISPIKK